MIEVTLWAYWRVIEGGGEASRLITWDLGEGDEALPVIDVSVLLRLAQTLQAPETYLPREDLR